MPYGYLIKYKEYEEQRDNANKVDELYQKFIMELSPNTVQYFYEIEKKYNEFDTVYKDYISKLFIDYATTKHPVVVRMNKKDSYKGICDLYEKSKQLTDSLLDRLKDILNKDI
jgi:hypothetical protein